MARCQEEAAAAAAQVRSLAMSVAWLGGRAAAQRGRGAAGRPPGPGGRRRGASEAGLASYATRQPARQPRWLPGRAVGASLRAAAVADDALVSYAASHWTGYMYLCPTCDSWVMPSERLLPCLSIAS